MNSPEPIQPLKPPSESKTALGSRSYWPILVVLISPMVLGLILVLGQRGERSSMEFPLLMMFLTGPVCAHLTLKNFSMSGWKQIFGFLLLTPLYIAVSFVMLACGCVAIGLMNGQLP